LSQNKLPPRPPIFLNNNASLYTFPNPNAGKPSQLAFAFVAVAHEDCRLFNNGAKLMPKYRLMAAECMNGTNGMNPTPLPPGTGQLGFCWDAGARFGRPVFQINVPRPPGAITSATCIVIRTVPPIGAPGTINGINFARPGLYNPFAYGYGYGGNYETYNPGSSQSTLSTSPASSSQSRGFQGFSLPNDADRLIEFAASVGIDPLTQFGSGFGLKCWCCNMTNPEPGPEPSTQPGPIEGNE
jgi:hypothetical protein